MRNIKRAFEKVNGITIDKAMENRIFSAVLNRQKNMIARNKLFFVFGFFVSLISFVGIATSYWMDLVMSEFWSIIFLVFSDSDVVFAEWNSFFWLLLETFPAAEISLILIPILALFVLAIKIKVILSIIKVNNANLSAI